MSNTREWCVLVTSIKSKSSEPHALFTQLTKAEAITVLRQYEPEDVFSVYNIQRDLMNHKYDFIYEYENNYPIYYNKHNAKAFTGTGQKMYAWSLGPKELPARINAARVLNIGQTPESLGMVKLSNMTTFSTTMMQD